LIGRGSAKISRQRGRGTNRGRGAFRGCRRMSVSACTVVLVGWFVALVPRVHVFSSLHGTSGAQEAYPERAGSAGAFERKPRHRPRPLHVCPMIGVGRARRVGTAPTLAGRPSGARRKPRRDQNTGRGQNAPASHGNILHATFIVNVTKKPAMILHKNPNLVISRLPTSRIITGLPKAFVKVLAVAVRVFAPTAS
jgi:hypothetical protein